jgi:Ca2+-transporting ATPase
VLCTDKTGTLTENRMSVAELRLVTGETCRPRGEAGATLPEPFHDLVEYSLLASAPDPFDPTERAFHDLGRQQLVATEHLHGADWTLVHTYALRPERLAMSQVWQADADRSRFVVAAKGAPEAVAALCRLTPEARAVLTPSVEGMAGAGLRVLGVARARLAGDALPERQEAFAFELLGFVGLADPLRASVPAAVAECRSAGIRVVMITGDYPATARAIATRAGLDAGDLVTGDELAAMSDDTLTARARTATVFARVMPEQKLRIVAALKADGEIVAMTGDGVNDAPSLKAAHIGIAMGGRGTDVAREASAIVLLDDDFGSIVASIRLGRRIYDNLRKAMGFILAVHVPIAGLALLPLVAGLPILLGPMHIAFLEMVIDPVCSLVFEAEVEEQDVMRRRPRPPEAPLFSGTLVGWSLVQGSAVLALVGTIFLVASRRGMPEPDVRALTFFALVLSIVSLIFVNRSFSTSLVTALTRPNAALRWVLVVVVAMLAVTLQWPVASALFHFGPLHADDLARTAAGGVLVFVVLETVKPLWRRRLPA